MGKCANCGHTYINQKKFCPRGVPKTYAKIKNKVMAKKIENVGSLRSEEDNKAFLKRFDEISDSKIGEHFTIEGCRKDGYHGQEDREVFNLLICHGKISKKQINKPGKPGEYYEVFERVEEKRCNQCDITSILKKKTDFCKLPIKEFKEKRFGNDSKGDDKGF